MGIVDALATSSLPQDVIALSISVAIIIPNEEAGSPKFPRGTHPTPQGVLSGETNTR
jgi:hypothetical protein